MYLNRKSVYLLKKVLTPFWSLDVAHFLQTVRGGGGGGGGDIEITGSACTQAIIY